MPISPVRGRPSGALATSVRMPAYARPRPTTPPASASVRLSDSSSQAIRREPAPSAAWIASSCCLASARTRNRLATLAQAMSRTRPTVPRSTQSTRPTSPMTSADERPDVGADLDVVEHLARESGRHREPIRDDRDEARDVGVCLLQRHAGLQPRHTAVAEVGRVQLRPVEAEREDELRVAIEEAEPRGKHADDLARLAVDDDRLADDGLIAAELAFPVSVAEDHALGRLRRVVVGREVRAPGSG